MLTFITVNYNNAAATVALLRSLERSTRKDFAVIVVDNDSRPDDRAMLGQYAASSPLQLDIIYSERNRGFSGGNNLGIRKALAQQATWVLLINNDTTVGEEFVDRLSQQLNDTPALIGVPLHESDRIAYAGHVRWLATTLDHVHAPVSRITYPVSRLYAIGGGMIVHRDVFERIGLLDERYFLYFEDADFSVRARRAGIPLRFLDHPAITHAVSGSTRALGSLLLLRYHMRNALLFDASNGPWWVHATLPFWSFWITLKQLGKLVFMPSRRASSQAILAGVVDYYGHRFGHLPPHPDHRY